jgi:hypothetical protein
MRKWMMGGIIFSFLLASTAYAHVSGTFGNFLGGVINESTTEKLKKEIKQTKKEIEELTPRVDQMEAEFNKKADIAVSKLQFYNTIGLDTYMNFILQSEDIVDVLANQRIVEKKLQEDLQDLNKLYLDYMPVKLAKDSLESHIKLLDMIRANLEARETFFAENEFSTPAYAANAIAEIWEENAASLDELLQEDSKLLNDNIKQFVTRKTIDSPYRLEEDLFNQESKVTYYFRSDHVYVHFKKNEADVMLIGQVSKTNENTARLEFEAGFLNGVSIASELLEKLPGFQLDYTNLNPNSKGFFVEQMNGAIMILPEENSAE